MLDKDKKEDEFEEKRDERLKSGKEPEKGEKRTRKKSPSGSLYTAMPCGALLVSGGLFYTFHVNWGASDHLVRPGALMRILPARRNLAASSGKIHAYSTAFVNRLE